MCRPKWLVVALFVSAFCLAIHTGSAAHAQLLRQLEDRLSSDGQSEPSPADAGAAPSEAGAADSATAERGYLGLVADNAENSGGAIVVEVADRSPAAAAGIRPGDVITSAGGKQVQSLDDLAAALAGLAANSKVAFTTLRAGREERLEVTLGRSAPPPADPQPPPPGARPEVDSRPLPPSPQDTDEPLPPEPALGRPTLGITVAPITDDLRATYNLTTRRGALVAAIRPESPADRAGLPVGAAIVAIDGVRIDTADQLVDAIRTSRPGQEVELTYYHGPRLTRKTVRLGSAGPAPLPEGTTPGVGIDLGDRPLLRAAERVMDSIARPGAGAAPPVDVSNLLREIDELRAQVQSLEGRVRALENQLRATDAGSEASSPPANPPPGEENRAPRLPLLQPTSPTP